MSLPDCLIKLGLRNDLYLHLSLQQLCAVPEIANSEEVQEFLALNTDARIAFVKKPFVVSRIDKVGTVGSCFPEPFPAPPERLQCLLGAKTLFVAGLRNP